MAKHYVICENDCLVEALTAEEVTALIQKATGYTPTGEEKAVISEIVNQNKNNESVKFWVGTRAEYNAVRTKDKATIYHITDDVTAWDAYEMAIRLDNLFRTYDSNMDGIIDNAEKLGGEYPNYYAKAKDLEEIRKSAGKVPTDHSWATKQYGAGSDVKYGHVMLSDSVEDVSNVNSGKAATPKAVNEAYTKAVSAYNLADKADRDATGLTNSIIETNSKLYALTTDITEIKVVASLPTDAHLHPTTLYLIKK